MLTSGGVPSTYAAGLATLATWSPRPQQAEADDQPAPNGLPLCECGRPLAAERRSVFSACARCQALDCTTDTSEMDQAVLDILDEDEDMSVEAIVEELSYRYSNKMIYYAVRRLVRDGKATRRRAPVRSEGHLYRRIP